MIAMDKVHSIRQLFYEQGKSVSAIAAETGHDRKTISKYLDMTDFNTPEPQMQTATFCGQQGRISRTVRAILNGQPGILAGRRVLRPTDQY